MSRPTQRKMSRRAVRQGNRLRREVRQHERFLAMVMKTNDRLLKELQLLRATASAAGATPAAAAEA